ncbi:MULTISPECIES: hypothetical protein [Pseudomonas]|jgi:hypothetical protein|uniref:hypothetical protein n=1 Tax=Pseudomonas TaxID=286 RepID=UPI001478DF62|nr:MULTISPECIES: hypothetical protein [Pseudomonas]
MTDNVIPLFGRKPTDPVVINEAYFEPLTNDQLAYRAWNHCDLAEEIFFSDEAEQDSLREAKFEVLMAQWALRVLVRRLTGLPALELREQVNQAFLDRLANDPDGLTSATEQGSGESLVMLPWPSYAGARHLPERERWVVYSTAKAYRAALEEQGIAMAEPYDQFVQRITAELEI